MAACLGNNVDGVELVYKRGKMTDSERLSPCIKMCCLNDDNICLGCFRSLDEICQWRQMTMQQRQEILDRAAVRKRAHDIKFGSE
ncbi:MAG: DUF1289 domain-containing protein [Methylobacter sp.]